MYNERRNLRSHTRACSPHQGTVSQSNFRIRDVRSLPRTTARCSLSPFRKTVGDRDMKQKFPAHHHRGRIRPNTEALTNFAPCGQFNAYDPAGTRRGLVGGLSTPSFATAADEQLTQRSHFLLVILREGNYRLIALTHSAIREHPCASIGRTEGSIFGVVWYRSEAMRLMIATTRPPRCCLHRRR